MGGVVEIALGGLAEQEVPLGGGVCEGQKGQKEQKGTLRALRAFKGFKGFKDPKKTLDVGPQKKCTEQDECKEYKKTLSEAATGCFVFFWS